MRKCREKDLIQSYYEVGRWLRDNWGLRRDSHLSQWFKEKGVHHSDDIPGIILHSFWRHLNDQPINLGEQIKNRQDSWKKIQGHDSGKDETEADK
jgi:hypothetical protein